MKTIVILTIALLLTTACASNQTEIVISTPPPQTPITPSSNSPVRIYITGCVQNPGVYELPAHSIVDDFLTAAGGPTADAWLDAINLAREPAHEDHVTIPCLPTPSPVVTDPAPGDGTPVTILEPGQACQPGQVNVNAANAVELESLPGIGPSLAQRIMEYIATNGPFQSVEDLTNVPGIGPTSLENLRPHVCTQ